MKKQNLTNLTNQALSFLFAVSIGGLVLQSHPIREVRADETTTDQMKDTGDQAKTTANKTERKAKKTTRDATGKKNVAKDAGDQISNAADDTTDAVKKQGRKADDSTK